MNHWADIRYHEPPKDMPVLTWECGGVSVAWWTGESFSDATGPIGPCSHWMYPPEPPPVSWHEREAIDDLATLRYLYPK